MNFKAWGRIGGLFGGSVIGIALWGLRFGHDGCTAPVRSTATRDVATDVAFGSREAKGDAPSRRRREG